MRVERTAVSDSNYYMSLSDEDNFISYVLLLCLGLFVCTVCSPNNGETASGESDMCETSIGEPFGPCKEDFTCNYGYCIYVYTENTENVVGTVCASPCTEDSGGLSCFMENSFCDLSGSYMRSCSEEDPCMNGQICDKAGDTAPYACFWPRLF